MSIKYDLYVQIIIKMFYVKDQKGFVRKWLLWNIF